MAVFNSRDQFMSEGGLRAAAGLDLGQHECSICLDAGSAETWDQLKVISKDLVQLPCMHIFCRECISQWLSCKTTCPYCRSTLFDVHDAQSNYSRISAGWDLVDIVEVRWEDADDDDLESIDFQNQRGYWEDMFPANVDNCTDVAIWSDSSANLSVDVFSSSSRSTQAVVPPSALFSQEHIDAFSEEEWEDAMAMSDSSMMALMDYHEQWMNELAVSAKSLSRICGC
jgi:hypothetical protein